jgi:hypothetical protein
VPGSPEFEEERVRLARGMLVDAQLLYVYLEDAVGEIQRRSICYVLRSFFHCILEGYRLIDTLKAGKNNHLER